MASGPNRRSLYIPCDAVEELRASRIQHRPTASESSAAASSKQQPHVKRVGGAVSIPYQQHRSSQSMHLRRRSQSQDVAAYSTRTLHHSHSIASSLNTMSSIDSQTHLMSSTKENYSPVDLKRTPSNASTESLNYDRGFRQTCIYEYDQKQLPTLPPPSPIVTTLVTISEKEKPTTATTTVVVEPTITRWVKFQTWFSPYRQILLSVTLINFVGLMLASQDVWGFPNKNPTALVTANVLIAVSIRSEWVLRLMFWITIKCFRVWLPLKMRAKLVGLLYHIGGLHSGCGVSALLWLSWATWHNFYNYYRYNAPLLFVMAVIFLCVAATCITALPIIRGPHHNVFEMTHRFAGWTAVVFTWVFVVLGSCWNSKRLVWDWSVGHLSSRPEFWCTYLFTILIGAAWISVDRVSVVCTAPSRKVTVIKFPEGLTSGVHARVSMGGLKEWHVFGTISEGKKSDCHYVVMAVQGNFTTAINRELPMKLYTRRWKLCGLPYFSRLFTKGVAICTGSGIGAVGSTCIQHDTWFLVWIGGDLEETYGTELCELVKTKTKGRSLIWDTKKRGRPDVMQLLEDTFSSWDAEVALFIGSPKMNEDVLRSCRARSIPAFGSIWDA